MTENYEPWSEDEAADIRRDLLAILACQLRGDEDGAVAVWHSINQVGAIPTCLGMLAEVLEDHGVDPVAWVAERQAAEMGAQAGGL